MTDSDGGQSLPAAGPSPDRELEMVRSLATSRRSFVGVVIGLLAGIGPVSASDQAETPGYGEGGYGEGGFGSGESTIERSPARYADEDGIVRSDGASDAVADWEQGNIETDLLLDVIDAWHDGEPVTDPNE